MYLSKAEILAADDLPTEDVDVPEWGGKVKIQGLTKAKQQSVRELCMDAEGYLDTTKLEIAMFLNCVSDPEFEESDIDALKGKSAKAFDRVAKASMRLTGTSEGVAEESAATFPEGD